MSDMREDLRATSESLQRDAQLVQEIEEQKGRLDPADPHVDELSARVDALIERMAAKSSAERQIAAQLRGDQPADRDAR
ncbi:MAG TPA: hypothetical protein VM305_05305 [Candidatus Limnocylindrales bacterium]|nr:hypothetical protein [Candidatus Limnocylindrales bacterium]